MSSSNSVVDRLRELTEANALQAKDIELDRLRTNYGLLKAHQDHVLKELEGLRALVTRYEGELRTVLGFIMDSSAELTAPVADVLALHEELRIASNADYDEYGVSWKFKM